MCTCARGGRNEVDPKLVESQRSELQAWQGPRVQLSSLMQDETRDGVQPGLT